LNKREHVCSDINDRNNEQLQARTAILIKILIKSINASSTVLARIPSSKSIVVLKVVSKSILILVPVILSIREERRLRAFENRILRRIFGPKRDGNGE
jgi:hypothetical protein